VTWPDIACLLIAAIFAGICAWSLRHFALANQHHAQVEVRAWQMKREIDNEIKTRVDRAVATIKEQFAKSGTAPNQAPPEDVGIAEAPPPPRIYGPNDLGPAMQTGTIDDKHEAVREARRKMSDVNPAKRDDLPGMMRDHAAVEG
jgi:hypothetical protein